MQDFKKLVVWQKAHDLTLAVYKATALFPKEEAYGLTAQIRRACVSIPANIVEGCGRDGDGEFHQFIKIAFGSAYELEYHLILARDLNYLNSEDYDSLMNQLSEIRKMLFALKNKVKPSNLKL